MNKETESYVTWLKKATENQVDFSIKIYENRKQLAHYFEYRIKSMQYEKQYLLSYYVNILYFLKPNTPIYEIDFGDGETEYYDDPEIAFHVLMNIELENKDTL